MEERRQKRKRRGREGGRVKREGRGGEETRAKKREGKRRGEWGG